MYLAKSLGTDHSTPRGNPANGGILRVWRKELGAGQQGFTMVELIVTLSIIAVLAVAITPYARGRIIESEVKPTALDIGKTIEKIRGNFVRTAAVSDYATVGTGAAGTSFFARMAGPLASTLTMTGSGGTATLSHALGSNAGPVTAASATIAVVNDAFSVTVSNVNESACPGLAAQLNLQAEVIDINGTSAKATGGAYNAVAAQSACVSGDANIFVFTFR